MIQIRVTGDLRSKISICAASLGERPSVWARRTLSEAAIKEFDQIQSKMAKQYNERQAAE